MNRTQDENHRKHAAQDMLSHNLKAAIRRHGWTSNVSHGSMAEYVLHLAAKDKANIGEGALGGWIFGSSLPRYTSLLQLAKWLNCEPSDLLEKRFWDLLKGYGDESE